MRVALHPVTNMLTVGHRKVRLAPKQANMLWMLMSRHVCTRAELIAGLYSPSYIPETIADCIRAYAYRLNLALSGSSWVVRAVRIGYQLVAL